MRLLDITDDMPLAGSAVPGRDDAKCDLGKFTARF
jgi:hypothetical protein